MSESERWAVVHDGATKYVGFFRGDENFRVTLTDAFELVLLRMPQQTRTGDVAIATAVHHMPIGLALGPTTIHVNPTAVELFSEMSERDRAIYEKLVEDAHRSFRERSAEAAGIVLPKG